VFSVRAVISWACLNFGVFVMKEGQKCAHIGIRSMGDSKNCLKKWHGIFCVEPFPDLGWAGLDWTGLDWTGLGWAVLVWLVFEMK
jgi:hypothetical protein